MPIEKIHHIGIGVPDLDASIEFYTQALGLGPAEMVDWPELGLKAALFRVGETIIELIQPLSAEGEIAEDLAQMVLDRGWGIHHIAVEVPDLSSTLARLKSNGAPLLDETPKTVAGGRIAWLRNGAMPGGLVELVETGYEIC